MTARKNGPAPQVIRHGTGATPVGEVLLALTGRGLCALRLLTDTPLAAELDELRRLFPRAELVPDPQAGAPGLWQGHPPPAGRPAAPAPRPGLRAHAAPQPQWET